MTDDELYEWSNLYYRQTGEKDTIAYTITDKVFGEFHVLNTANGWWKDSEKVKNLIQAYKWGCTNEEACTSAGIDVDNLDYFQKLHPKFLGIKNACREVPTLTARKSVFKALEDDYNHAMKYLERKKRDEFGQNIDVTSKGNELSGLTVGFTDFDNDKDTDNPSGDEGK